jgi:arylformamidase
MVAIVKPLYDISPKLTHRTAVFPGDVPFLATKHLSFDRGDHLMLSSIQTTVHAGAHADAPCHYHEQGADISNCDLSKYLGLCQVVTVESAEKNGRIYPHHISTVKISAPRVLFRTNSFPEPEIWTPDFFSLSPEIIEYLAELGVTTVGIDTPSVDPHDSKDLESHQALYHHGFAVLEGLILEAVPDGEYTLIALPLPLVGLDASPVRAVLLPPRAPII